MSEKSLVPDGQASIFSEKRKNVIFRNHRGISLRFAKKNQSSFGHLEKKGDHWGLAGFSTNKPYQFNTDWLKALIQDKFYQHKAIKVLVDLNMVNQ